MSKLAIAVVGALVATTLATVTPASAQDFASERAARAAALDVGHFSVGVRDRLTPQGTITWAPQTGIPFDSVYQYVSGTGPGTPGDYHVSTIVAYAKIAHADGYLPVLSYFRMDGDAWGPASVPARCTGACLSGDSAKRNLDHLEDPGFMYFYFDGLISAFKALNAQYDGPMLMHFEPDLSGYAQMLVNDRTRCDTDCLSTVTAESPAAVLAAVSLSGQTDVKDFPNTLQGFYLAVLHLRDLYAPRVSLAYHVSDWATADVYRKTTPDDRTNDIGQSHVDVDAAALADRVASFAAQDGASTDPSLTLPGVATSRYDLLFNDVLDHDAAYVELRGGNPGYWWDSENIDVPNFARWEAYIHRITSDTGLKAIVWQVPEGNTVYLTENDTTGHYQDNRVQYFFDHIPELAAAGLVGVIFGNGTAGSSATLDLQNDGVTNGSPTCTTRGSHSHTSVCTSRVSTVPDDDGGYLRDRAAAYFAAPYLLP
ncbi:MAG: hypothetical protein QOD07_879 [Frankiaceae bacterium]|jgi:hypothetical protein|nr:hypothetical protein [Frankiaceae bacterium]